MGSWNGTCAVSNLHIKSGTPVVVFMLLENKEKKSFCYSNALYDISPIPFYGEYDDYGAVENCHGFGLNLTVEALKSQLYEFGQGGNEYHDIEVNRGNFDVEKMFEADHEDRLGIEFTRYFDGDEYSQSRLQEKIEKGDGLTTSQRFEMDRLVNKIRKVDNFRRVTHVIVHADIFKDITEKWFIEKYVGDGKGTTGYDNNYIHVYFRDILAGVPEHVQALKALKEEIDKISDLKEKMEKIYGDMAKAENSWKSENLATKWMGTFSRGSGMDYGLIDVTSAIEDYKTANDWQNLELFIIEVLKAAWISSFMESTRKLWSKQTGAGGQSDEALGYQILAKSTLDILAAETAYWADVNGEDEDDGVA
jgi:hypothetical protein